MTTRTKRLVPALVPALLAALAATAPLFAGGWEITSFTVDGGGGTAAQDQWVLHGTIGQHDASHTLTGDEFTLAGGFWPGGGDGPVTTCPGDINGDGGVGFADLTDLLAAWGACPGCPEDLDGNGTAGFSDLTALLSLWGPCP